METNQRGFGDAYSQNPYRMWHEPWNTGWFIEILWMACYSPCILYTWVVFDPLYNPWGFWSLLNYIQIVFDLPPTRMQSSPPGWHYMFNHPYKGSLFATIASWVRSNSYILLLAPKLDFSVWFIRWNSWILVDWLWLFNLPPPNVPPPRNKGLTRPYYGKPMVNKPLIRPAISGRNLPAWEVQESEESAPAM